MLASARVPKFDWKAGEHFTAEIWLLNDSPASAVESIRVSILLGGKEYPLLVWESGVVPANQNLQGPTINWVLPDVDATDMTLRLQAGSASSEYRLCYRKSAAMQVSRQLNV